MISTSVTGQDSLQGSAANCVISNPAYVYNPVDLGKIYSNVSLTAAHTVSSPSISVLGSSTGTAVPWYTQNPVTASTRIQLQGENADIEVNGWSLVDAVKRIEQRLNLLQTNPELEAEWEELRALGERYRQLEQHIQDKQATFDRLKSMPPPDIE